MFGKYVILFLKIFFSSFVSKIGGSLVWLAEVAVIGYFI